jgi:hypothetical protein
LAITKTQTPLFYLSKAYGTKENFNLLALILAFTAFTLWLSAHNYRYRQIIRQ